MLYNRCQSLSVSLKLVKSIFVLRSLLVVKVVLDKSNWLGELSLTLQYTPEEAAILSEVRRNGRSGGHCAQQAGPQKFYPVYKSLNSRSSPGLEIEAIETGREKQRTDREHLVCERGRPEGFSFLCSESRQQSEEAAGQLERLASRDSSNCVSETTVWLNYRALVQSQHFQTTGQALVWTQDVLA